MQLSGEIIERECGQGISCEEVCSEEGAMEIDTDVDLDTSCIAVIMDDEDPAQAARQICRRYSANFAADPFFCRDPSFLPPSSVPGLDSRKVLKNRLTFFFMIKLYTRF